MTSLVILAVSYCGEALHAVFALVGLLSCVSPHVYKKITFLSKDPTAVRDCAFEKVLAGVSGLYMKIKSRSSGE